MEGQWPKPGHWKEWGGGHKEESQLNLCSAPLFIPAYYGPDNVLNLNHALQNQPQVIDLIHSVFPGARKIQERDELLPVKA